jgi:hypothetical protein
VQAVQLVGCGVIGAALAVLVVSVCFWLAVLVGGVICCGGGRRSGAAGRQQGQRREDGQKKKARADGAACAAALAFGLHWRQWFRRGASRCRWWG